MSAVDVKKVPASVSTFAPLPVTQRGFGIHVHGTSKGEKRLIYGSEKNVILRYIDEPARADVFSGHRSNVTVAKFSPNGEWIASGDETGVVMVWAAKSMIVKNEVRCCSGILDIDWSGTTKNDMIIIAGGNGGQGHFAKVFRWDSRNSIGDITNNSKKLLSVTIRPDGKKIATVSEEKQTNFYEKRPFKFSKSDHTHTNYPNCVRYSPDGSLFATAGSDSKIVVYDGETGDKVREFPKAHTGSIYSLSWSPDGTQLLTASGDKTAKIFNAADGSVATNFAFGNAVGDMQVSALWLGDDLITVSLSGEINFLDIAAGKPKKTWTGHKALIDAIAVSPDGQQIYSGDREGRLAAWECKSGEAQIFAGEGHQGDAESSGFPVQYLAVSADGKKLFSAGSDNKLFVSDTASLKTPDQWLELERAPTCLAAANKDASLVVVGTANGAFYFAENGKQKNVVKLGFVPTAVSFSPDDSEITIGGKDNIARVYSRSGTDINETAKLENHKDGVSAIAYSADGTYLTTTDKGRHVFIWTRADLSKPINPMGWQFHQARVTGAAWTNDSAFLLTSASDEMAIKWLGIEKKRSKNEKRRPAHLGGVDDIQILDDNHYVTVGADRHIRVWAI